MPNKHDPNEDRFNEDARAANVQFRFPWEHPEKRASDNEEPLKERVTKTIREARKKKRESG